MLQPLGVPAISAGDQILAAQHWLAELSAALRSDGGSILANDDFLDIGDDLFSNCLDH
jgi:hypothetical protein